MKITASHTNPDNSRNADAIIFQYRSAANKMIETVIFLLVTVFPLILHDSYYDILETKYCFYTLCSDLKRRHAPSGLLYGRYSSEKLTGRTCQSFAVPAAPRQLGKKFLRGRCYGSGLLADSSYFHITVTLPL